MATKQPGNSSGIMNSIFDSFIATSKSKDIEALNKSITNLSKILERRVGKAKKSSELTEDTEDKQRTLVGDLKDFGKGFITPFTDAKRYVVGGNKQMPPNMGLKSEEGNEKSENKVLTLSQFKNELLKMKNTELEKNLLAEVVIIRKIVAQKAGYGTNKTAVPALSGTGLEPNSDDDKQRDRKLLAEAIADKLKNIGLGNSNGGGGIISSILEALGLSKLLGKTPNVPPVPGTLGPDKPNKEVPDTKKKPGGLFRKGLNFAGRVAGKLALPLTAGMAAYDGIEGFNADPNATTGQKFKNAGRNIASGLTFGMIDPTEDKRPPTSEAKSENKSVTPVGGQTIDPNKMGMTSEQARNALGGSNRDIEKLGGREALLKIANTDFESSGSSKDLKEQIKIKEQTLKTSGPMLNAEYRDKLQTDIDTLNKRIPTADVPDQMAAETARLNRYANIETKQSSATADKVGPNQAQSLESNLASSFTNETLKQLQAATTGDQKIDMLKRLEDENMDLKEAKESISQILAPMITNRTVDNSTQQFVTSPPRPYPNTNGVDKWQDKRY